MEELGIYIHIPFCKKKCKYCDFISFSCYAEKENEYVDVFNPKDYDFLYETRGTRCRWALFRRKGVPHRKTSN